MQPCDDTVFSDYNSGFLSSNLYTEDEINYIKSNSLCLSNNITVNLQSKLNRKDSLQIAFPYESFSELIKKYQTIGIIVNYKRIVLNPNNQTKFYSELWRQEVYYPDTLYQSFYNLEMENYNFLKDETFFLLPNEEEKQIVNAKRFYLASNMLTKRFKNYDYVSVLNLGKAEMSTNALIKYKSFNDVISGFGGSFEIIKILFEFVGIQLMKSFYYTSMINKNFKFNEVKKKYFNRKIYNKNTNSEGNNYTYNFSKNEKTKFSPSMKNTELNKIDKIDQDVNKLENTSDKKSNRSNKSIISNKEKPELSLRFKNNLKNRKNKKITSIEYLTYSLTSSCFLFFRKNKLKLYYRIIESCYKLIEHNSDLSNLIKLGMDLEFIKNILFSKYERNIYDSLSLSLNCDMTLKLLNKFSNKEISDTNFEEKSKLRTELKLNNEEHHNRFLEFLTKYYFK
jgi:hypothetical protein